MKFCEWSGLYEYLRRRGVFQGSCEQFAEISATLPTDSPTNQMAIAESVWMLEKRPYYCVYPAVLPLFLKFKLDQPGDVFQPDHKVILIRLPEQASGTPLRCVMFAAHRNDNGALILFVSARFRAGGPGGLPDKDWFSLQCLVGQGELIETAVTRFEVIPTDHDDASVEMDDYELSMARDAVRLGLCLLLLEHDPDIIQPDVLADDRRRWEAGDAELQQRLEEKARRRGKLGWLVGAQLEQIPHLRRPHFALRWTGQGRTIPKIVPVKGAIVHRDVVQKVPTGHMG